MIDQFVIGFKPQRFWGSLAAADFFLGGTGAGAFILSVALELLPGMVVGWLAVAAGAVALLIDLGRPRRFMRASAGVSRSWTSRGALCTTVFLLFGIVYIVSAIASGPASVSGNGTVQAVGAIASLGALGVMLYTGFLLSQSPSIPFWNTTMLPLLFALSAFTCGIGAVMILAPLGQPVDSKAMSLAGAGLLAASLVFLWTYMVSMSSSTVAAKQSVQMLVSGQMAIEFLVGVNVIGLVAPLAITLVAYMGSVAALLPLAGLLTLLGGFLFRRSMLKGGIYPPVIDI